MDRIVVLLWSIWKIRNNKIFRNETSSPRLSLLRAKQASAEWRIRHKLFQIYNPSPHTYSNSRSKQSRWISWSKPLGGFIKINFDESKNSQAQQEVLSYVTGEEGFCRLLHSILELHYYWWLKLRQCAMDSKQ